MNDKTEPRTEVYTSLTLHNRKKVAYYFPSQPKPEQQAGLINPDDYSNKTFFINPNTLRTVGITYNSDEDALYIVNFKEAGLYINVMYTGTDTVNIFIFTLNEVTYEGGPFAKLITTL